MKGAGHEFALIKDHTVNDKYWTAEGSGTFRLKPGVKPSEARTIHQRPAVIQELAWQPQFLTGASARTDPVRTITCSFYNGRLFRIVVTYDRDKIEGLTELDIVEAMSASYGLATLRATHINLSAPPAQDYLASDYRLRRVTRVAALWEDSPTR
jgi:hypothetical protein